MRNERVNKSNPESRFYFKATFHFGHWGREGADVYELEFDDMEEMIAAYVTERRRRKKSERVTSGTYSLELTAAGLEEWRKDQACEPHGFRARCREDIGRKIKI